MTKSKIDAEGFMKFCEAIEYSQGEDQRTNAHLYEQKIMINNWDVVVYGSATSVKLLVFDKDDTDRMNATLRFNWVRMHTATYLKVVLAIWKFCN